MSLRILALLLIALLLSACVGQRSPFRPDQVASPPLTFAVPQVEQRVLDNGMRLYLNPDHELPLIKISLMIGAGSIGEPAAKSGLVQLYAAALRSGGAGRLSPQAFDDNLEAIAADLAVSSGSYSVSCSLSLHRDDLESGLALFADLLRRPRFDEQRMELARRQMLEGIRRQNDEPGAIAQRHLRRSLYGDHPLGRTPTLDTVEAISGKDLLGFHSRYVLPNNLWLAVSGDFDPTEMELLLGKLFGDWPLQPFEPQEIPPLTAPLEPVVLALPKEVPQTTVLLGQRGITKDHPDLYALRVMNFILGGGGFNSRLMREVRSNRGLAYSVYSFFQAGRRLPGLFVAGCETRTESVDEVVILMRDEMRRISEEPVSEEELKTARQSLVNSFVFAFENPHEVVSQAMRLDFYGYAEDYLQGYRDRLAAVTADEVLDAARQHLQWDGQMIVLVGEQTGSAQPAERFGLPVAGLPDED
ncbi:MAG: insulinase family protein [Desulfuromonadaceae bacterium]|nr:insulinase family protein [Desulfuromonadaceae bacterium]